jgi:hypothetical protein
MFPAVATTNDNPNVDHEKLRKLNDELARLAPATSKAGRAATFDAREIRAAAVRRAEREARRIPKA